MKVLDLFSGIGGFSLGLEMAGMKTAAFCEADNKCRLVLKKHWPDVPVYNDIKQLTYERLKHDGIRQIDLICGGFPCQDISVAGKGAGMAGSRSGLWSEFARIIRDVCPKFAIVENVSALLNRGLDRVLGDLAEIGYDAVWHCIPASAVGAPHRRDRIWIVAYPSSMGCKTNQSFAGGVSKVFEKGGLPKFTRSGSDVSDSHSERLKKQRREIAVQKKVLPAVERVCESLADPDLNGAVGNKQENRKRSGPFKVGWWEVEPGVGRVADGVPHRVDRLRQLGNAVVPQIPYLIGKAIMQTENVFQDE